MDSLISIVFFILLVLHFSQESNRNSFEDWDEVTSNLIWKHESPPWKHKDVGGGQSAMIISKPCQCLVELDSNL